MSNGIVIETRGLTRRFHDTAPRRGIARRRTAEQGSKADSHGSPATSSGIVAVDNLDLTVSAGEVFGFLGHNGAGKTTTIRLLNGVLGPTSGTMRVLGFDPTTEGPRLRRQTGVLTETPSLDDRLTARETLTIYGTLYHVDAEMLPDRVAALLEAFDLGTRADELVGGYSKGMRQRLALARTLIHEPRILFLDEPTASLDPVGQRSVHELIVDLSRGGGRTIFLCTHDLIEAQKLCDRVAVLEQGRVVASGTPEGLAQQLQKGVAVEITFSARASQAVRTAIAQVRNAEVVWSDDGHVAQARLPIRDAVADLVAALVDAGARIYSIQPQEPTLEDVYFALHDHNATTGSLGVKQTGDHDHGGSL